MQTELLEDQVDFAALRLLGRASSMTKTNKNIILSNCSNNTIITHIMIGEVINKVQSLHCYLQML